MVSKIEEVRLTAKRNERAEKKAASAKKASTVKKSPAKEANESIVMQVGPSREAFMAAVVIKSDFDFANFGKMQPSTFNQAVELAKLLDAKYEELVRNA